MPNINDYDRLYRRTEKGSGVTGSIVNLELDRVAPDLVRVLTHVTVENKTNDYTKVRLAINARGTTIYLDELTSPTANELAVSRSDILLGEGDILFAELTGTTDGDKLVMTAIGWQNRLKRA
jgi:hypothetical protein